MPGAIVTTDILFDMPVALDQKVGGNPQFADFGEKRMRISWQAVGKQSINHAGTKFTRRQTDIVDYQQRNLRVGPLIEVF